MKKLYLLGKSWQGPIKIGVSFNPVTRLRTLQTGSAEPIALLAIAQYQHVDAAECVEWLFKNYLSPTRLVGEWFKVRSTDMLVMFQTFSISLQS